MLKKAFRLNKKTGVFGQSFTAPFFSVRIKKNNLSHNRFGFIVSKRIDKRAVVRNRLKRVFRSNIEDSLEQMRNGYDMLFILRKQVAQKTREEMRSALTSFLKSKGFYNEENS